ncbi:MAG TPA: F0F1 ATP synthase subunit A [Candidatus Saccharimonadia bacterium]
MLLAAGPQVSLVAEHLFDVGPIHVTNSMLLGLLGTAVVVWALFYTVGRVRSGQHNRFSVAVLWLFESLLNTAADVLGSREMAVKLAPLAITMFFVICLNNWFGLLPVVGPLTWHGEPLFRGLASDLNFTAALALITMITAQMWAIRTHGFFGNIGRYIANPFTKPMKFFEGFLEIIAEFSRLIALAMRLFGNIFGGEVLLAVMGFITAWAAPLALPPFMFLEIFVGAIQAYVFFMLTCVFVSLGVSHHDDGEEAAVGLPEDKAVPVT